MIEKRRRFIIYKIIDLYFDAPCLSDSEYSEAEKTQRILLSIRFMEWLSNGEDEKLKEEALLRKFDQFMHQK